MKKAGYLIGVALFLIQVTIYLQETYGLSGGILIIGEVLAWILLWPSPLLAIIGALCMIVGNLLNIGNPFDKRILVVDVFCLLCCITYLPCFYRLLMSQ